MGFGKYVLASGVCCVLLGCPAEEAGPQPAQCAVAADCPVTGPGAECRGVCDGGTCSDAPRPDACFIDGACATAGQASASDPCAVCLPLSSHSEWQPAICAPGSVCVSEAGGCIPVVEACTPECVNGDCVGHNSCDCDAGWTGPTCEKDIDECASNPCQNGGKCAHGVANFTCTCAAGWTGDVCDKDSDECAAKPCKNGGECSDGFDSFTCECAPGFEGETCTTNIDDCTVDACQNDGTCVDGVNSFTCDCAEGWTGDACEEKVQTICDPNPCLNDGECVAGETGFECTCATGYAGELCAECAEGFQDNDTDDLCEAACSAITCEGLSECDDSVGPAACICTVGGTYPDCE